MEITFTSNIPLKNQVVYLRKLVGVLSRESMGMRGIDRLKFPPIIVLPRNTRVRGDKGDIHPLLAALLVLYFSRRGGRVLDPMALNGVLCRVAAELGRNPVCMDIEYGGRIKHPVFDELVTGDATRMPIADSSVDLIVTSPPYLDIVKYTEKSKLNSADLGEYLAAMKQFLEEAKRVLKKNSYIIIRLKGVYDNDRYIPLESYISILMTKYFALLKPVTITYIEYTEHNQIIPNTTEILLIGRS